MPQVPLAPGPQVRPTVAPLPGGQPVVAPSVEMGNFTLRQPAPLQAHDLTTRPRDFIPTDAFHSAYNEVQPLHADTAAATQAAVARGVGQASDVLGDISNAIQTQTNALLTDGAVNKAKELAMRLAYDKDTGFTSLKGYSALNRPDGKPLADEYANRFDEGVKALSGDLKNDAQRRAFAAQALGIRSSLYGQATQHETQEFRNYNLSTQEGTINTETNSIGLNYRNPDAVNNSVERIKGAVAEMGFANGKSAAWIESAQRDAVSKAHSIALTAAMEDGNVVFADAYMSRHKGDMNADDVLRVRGAITKDMDGRMGIAAAKDAVAAITPNFQATDFDRVLAITQNSESRGHDLGPDGKVLTSPKGAKGRMQVMDGTNSDPGFGVQPARDGSLDERARVGRDYMGAMIKRYNGDMALAWAANNWGPGHVDEALAEAKKTGKSWFDLAPAETQGYVRKNLAAYAGGQGDPPTPTLEQVMERIDADPRVNSSPARLEFARREATSRFESMAKAKKTGDEDATANALKMVEANGGNYMSLPLKVRQAIPAERIDTVMNFADKVRGGNTVTNLATYQKLTDDKALVGMSDSQFYALRPELSPSDFQHFADHRAKLIDPKQAAANGPGELNTPAIHMVVENRLQSMGIDPTPASKDTKGMERVGAINKTIREQIILAQQQAGRKFTDAETEGFIDTLFSKSIPFRASLFGFVGPDSKRMLEMTPGDLSADTKASLRGEFKKRGVTNPSDFDLLGAYWRHHATASR